MALGKQAKVLNRAQTDAVLAYLEKTRHPARNRLIFLLSIRAGLLAKEIAALTWSMVMDKMDASPRTLRCLTVRQKGGQAGPYPSAKSCTAR